MCFDEDVRRRYRSERHALIFTLPHPRAYSPPFLSVFLSRVTFSVHAAGVSFIAALATEHSILSVRALFLSALYVPAVLGFLNANPRIAFGEPIPAKNTQGTTHGFLVLKSSDGKVIAVGDMLQVAHGRKVRSRLVFHFADGSVDDETTVFLQGRVFQLVSDHHIQKGPSFPKPLDLAVDVPTSTTTSREMKDGQEEVTTQQVDLPDDLANGMVTLVLQNIAPETAATKVSYLVGSPKPRVVKLSITPEGQESFVLGRVSRHAKRYKIHIELGGIAGVVAPVIGKQPSDLHIWVADGDIPTVVKTEGALYEEGPIWTMEQAAPVWTRAAK